MVKMNVALSIDWDFFFDDSDMDWGHREAPFFIETIWESRALDFKMADKDYCAYAPKGVGEFLHMLKTLNLKPPAVYVSESHLYANPLFMGFTPNLLVNFDAHADMSPKHPQYLDCENWLYWLLKRKPRMKAVWVFPEHSFLSMRKRELIDRAINLSEEVGDLAKLPNFSYVQYSEFEDYWKRMTGTQQVMLSYICRSGAWTPPWADEDFDKFVGTVSEKRIYHEGMKVSPRLFSPPSDEVVAQLKAQMEKLRNGKAS